MILPDSNIWIYGIDSRTTENDDVVSWFDRADDEIFLIPSIVQLEVLHHLERTVKDEATRDKLAAGLFSFPSSTRPLAPATVRRARDVLEDHLGLGIGGRDAAVLVHAMSEEATLVTHDEGLFRAARRVGLDAHDPVAGESG